MIAILGAGGIASASAGKDSSPAGQTRYASSYRGFNEFSSCPVTCTYKVLAMVNPALSDFPVWRFVGQAQVYERVGYGP